MFTFDKNFKNKEEMYEKILTNAKYMFEDINNDLTNLSNASALLNVYLQNINWVGFYLTKDDYLYLGPFQGLPACTKIKIGNGVCGTCAKTLQTQIVKDVHQFPGHIACDSQSNSEIVLPIIINDRLYGVLDIDSPLFNNFDEIDEKYLKLFLEILTSNLILNTKMF